MLKLFILFYLFIVSFSSLNATEITFSVSDYWRQGLNSDDDNKVWNQSGSDPLAYTVGLKNWKNGIFHKQKSSYLKNFSLNYTAEYTVANSEYKATPSTGYFKGRFSRQLYEIYLSRNLNNKLKIFIGYGFQRHKSYNAGRTTTTNAILTTNEWHKYWYHPMGLIWTINPKWTLKSQYNRWHKGHSHQNDGIHYEYDYAWGLDFNINKKITENFSLFSFFKYWDVDDSDIISGSWFVKHEIEQIGVGISYEF